MNWHPIGHPMVSRPNSAPADRSLSGFATLRPEWFAVLITLAYVLLPLLLRLVAPESAGIAATWNPLQFAQLAWVVLVPTVVLTVLGWWGLGVEAEWPGPRTRGRIGDRAPPHSSRMARGHAPTAWPMRRGSASLQLRLKPLPEVIAWRYGRTHD